MNTVNFSAAERVDLSDLNTVSQETPLGFARELGAYFALSPANTNVAYVINGFQTTNPTGNQVQVNLGSAFLGRRVGLSVSYGVLTATGDATQSIDVSSFQQGTYGVYVTFDQVPAAFQNRTFWQAGDTPGEYAQNVPTQLASTWQMTITALNPGAEWLQVATLTLPNNVLTDTRPLYFEGNAGASYASNWGTGPNDRSANRGAYGVGDLQTFTAAMRTAIEDVKGPGLTRWWENKIGGQNIGFAGTPTLGRSAWGDAAFYAQGSTTTPALYFDASSALTYTRASQTFSFTPSGTAALNLLAGVANAPSVLSVGTSSQLSFSATTTTASAFFAPSSTSALFEQRATNATLSTLGFYAGTTLGGTFDANRNWVLGSSASGYAYPTVNSVASYSALTVADTSGNHLMRLDSSSASSIPAIASLRANQAMTALRFTPTASALSSSYNFQIAVAPVTSTLAALTISASGSSTPLLTLSQQNNIADFSGAQAVKCTTFSFPVGGFDCYPSIYGARVAGGTTNGAIDFGPSGGYAKVTGTTNSNVQTVLIPIPLPMGATVTSAFLYFSHGPSGSSSVVNFSIWGSPVSKPANPALIPGATPLLATEQSFGATTYSTIALNPATITPGAYYNYFASFGDKDSAAVNFIYNLHVYYSVPSVTQGYF